MEFNDYQKQAKGTAQLSIESQVGRAELVLGLSSEAGTVARIHKRHLRDKLSLAAQRPQLIDGLGDVLWYVAMIANSVGLNLDEVAKRNLDRTRDRYQSVVDNEFDVVADFDSAFPAIERFPQQMVFHLRAVEQGGLPHVEFSITQAIPHHFPDGPITEEGKRPVGYTLGAPIGAVINDNAIREDGYRFHDAVHVSFMTILGWSPVMRGLLRLKRKSAPDVDRIQDGARARDLEEALSAIIFELSHDRHNYANESDIDGDVRDLIRRVVANLEVVEIPVHRWAKAIHLGYKAMADLHRGNGGYLLADRKLGAVEYHEREPKL